MRTRIAFLLLIGLGLSSFNPLFAELKVVTTTEDLASLTRSIGGDLVSVTSIAKGTQDPHYVEAKPSFLVAMSRADLILSVGLSLESGWLPLLLRGARRPQLMPGAPGYLSVSDAITPIEVQANGDRSDGDVHPDGNPHFMADPERGLAVAERLCKKLAELDSAHAQIFENNFKQFKSQLEKKTLEWKSRLAKFKGTNVVGYHKTFNYFFHFFQLTAVGYLEPKPGIPPTVQHILSLVELTKQQKVKLIIVEDFFDAKPGKTLADKTGAKLLMLPAYVRKEESLGEYLSWLDTLVSKIETILK